MWLVRLPTLFCHMPWNELVLNCFMFAVSSGGTSVSGALECPENEQRMIVSLDTSQMVSSVTVTQRRVKCNCPTESFMIRKHIRIFTFVIV